MRIAAKSVQPGDTFALHLGNGVHGFARLVYVMEGHYNITEFFKHTSAKPEFDEAIFHAGRVIPLPNLDYTMLLSNQLYRWKPIFRDPNFEPDWNELKDLEFRYGVSNAERINFDWTPESKEMRIINRLVPLEEAEKLESIDTFSNPHWLYPRLRKAFDLHPNAWAKQGDLLDWMYHNGIFFTPMVPDGEGGRRYGNWKAPIPKKPDPKREGS